MASVDYGVELRDFSLACDLGLSKAALVAGRASCTSMVGKPRQMAAKRRLVTLPALFLYCY